MVFVHLAARQELKYLKAFQYSLMEAELPPRATEPNWVGDATVPELGPPELLTENGEGGKGCSLT